MQPGVEAPAAEAPRFARCSVQPEALRRTPVCTTGCPVIDRCAASRASLARVCRASRGPRRVLSGGIPGGSITELVGESTVGKTQLCLQLLLTAQLPEAAGGFAGRSLYISTEGNAPLGRLTEIAGAFPQLKAPCDSVLVANASASAEQLYGAVQQVRRRCVCVRCEQDKAPGAEGCIAQAASLVASADLSPPVRLIVIDSITNPFRELDATTADDSAARAKLLYQIACTLKEAAHRRAAACAGRFAAL